MPPATKVTFKIKVTLAVLVVINLLNYMDRYTLAGTGKVFLCGGSGWRIVGRVYGLVKGNGMLSFLLNSDGTSIPSQKIWS